MASEKYTIGVDFGTLSGRAVVVRVSDGAELGTGVHAYTHGVMDSTFAPTGAPLPPDWALQVPDDYRDVLRIAVPAAVAEAGIDPADVIGIGTDVTASTPLPTLADGTPLCETEGFADDPHAYVKLWKHHAAGGQASRINQLARDRDEPWLSRYGGFISSEWQIAKALQVLEEAPHVWSATARWVEAADWIIWQLGGRYRKSPTTAGYKGIFQDGHYPSEEFFAALDPEFADVAATRLAGELGSLGEAAGALTDEAAGWTGLPPGIAVAVGNVDAHVTVPAANASGPGRMVAIMGTSTCHVVNGEELAIVPGMCGVVDGGITAGSWGYEAGQSGVGDIFGWFVETGVPTAYLERARERGIGVHELLTDLGWAEPVGAHGLVALDWHSGNRSVLVDHELSGLVIGQTLATRPEQIYRALVEATAFGTRVIVQAFIDAGVPVTEFIAAGGLLKNRHLMQTYADVLRLPISTIDSEQGPALGAAIHAAVAAGAYPDVPTAGQAMGSVTEAAYTPNQEAADAYDRLFEIYRTLHDVFGREHTELMHGLKRLRREALS